MERQSRVHTCRFQQMVAEGKWEPRPHKCNCREMVPWQEADQRVKWGEALWVIIKSENRERKRICKICQGGDAKSTCDLCKGTGLMIVKVSPQEDPSNCGNDIVLLTHRTKSNRVSTPRVPTIEEEHIQRAYVEGNKEAAERIDEYGLLVLEARAFPGPRECRHRPEFTCSRCGIPKGEKEFVIGLEPVDNVKTATGRRYDWGRAV